MLKNVLQPQEIEVFYIIPAIRSYIAKSLKDLGKSQKEIAKLFGLRESTVSQYITGRRAKLRISKKTQEKIKEMSKDIKKPIDVVTVVQAALDEIKNDQEICKIHKQLVSKIPSTCCVCFKRMKS